MAIEHLKKVCFTGTSFYVVIPKNYIHAIGLKHNDYIVVRLTHDKLELYPYERNEQCKRI
jgi:antitoxin component of MazEF toxin-antitoxin module